MWDIVGAPQVHTGDGVWLVAITLQLEVVI